VAKATAMGMIMGGLKAAPFNWFHLGGLQAHDLSVEKHFQEWSAEQQVPPLRFASVGMTNSWGPEILTCRSFL
jgi:hypothetical protein